MMIHYATYRTCTRIGLYPDLTMSTLSVNELLTEAGEDLVASSVLFAYLHQVHSIVALAELFSG